MAAIHSTRITTILYIYSVNVRTAKLYRCGHHEIALYVGSAVILKAERGGIIQLIHRSICLPESMLLEVELH